MIPSARSCTCNVLLLILLVLQWVAFTWFLQNSHSITPSSDAFFEQPFAISSHRDDDSINQDDETIEGVFATILFRAPRWMHLRYTTMIHNALTNLPNARWRVQLFVNRPWVQAELLPWHPGLLRLFQDPRIIVTNMPATLTQGKPKQVLASRWFWETLVADAVVLFSGNGAFCTNHYNTDWDHFVQQVDFCGTPGRGRGGDVSTHSFRRRSTMLEATIYAEQHQMTPAGTEPAFILEVLEKMQKEGKQIRMGTTEDMMLLGGVTNLTNSNGTLQRVPLLVSGTQAKVAWTERDSLLKHCPELKMIFPSMHEPACFGAHPNPNVCQASICALQDVIPRQGC
ncbi:hypothetical protein FisN_15Lh063 [Fistulifera solaris]|uniref:DUF5672 domain-containing protein n=1 Tax=Fistulifera solaris TaxID=1519565 RepID=A0A1Z5KHX4_FISSO|nr:hypothetical protein FisN_15Lh063 [Fistulifera solaris]|eukprot:GAX25692.1 hypothetical protein FisN_15Lh063 [Fistulifera solaris]